MPHRLRILIVTLLQSYNVTLRKKTYFKFCGFLKIYYFCNRNEL